MQFSLQIIPKYVRRFSRIQIYKTEEKYLPVIFKVRSISIKKIKKNCFHFSSSIHLHYESRRRLYFISIDWGEGGNRESESEASEKQRIECV